MNWASLVSHLSLHRLSLISQTTQSCEIDNASNSSESSRVLTYTCNCFSTPKKNYIVWTKEESNCDHIFLPLAAHDSLRKNFDKHDILILLCIYCLVFVLHCFLIVALFCEAQTIWFHAYESSQSQMLDCPKRHHTILWQRNSRMGHMQSLDYTHEMS